MNPILPGAIHRDLPAKTLNSLSLAGRTYSGRLKV
jgi:hypothetical protein